MLDLIHTSTSVFVYTVGLLKPECFGALTFLESIGHTQSLTEDLERAQNRRMSKIIKSGQRIGMEFSMTLAASSLLCRGANGFRSVGAEIGMTAFGRGTYTVYSPLQHSFGAL